MSLLPPSEAAGSGSAGAGPAGHVPTAAPLLAWQWCRFEALSLQDLYDALQLRARVFILEQGPYLDPDGFDQRSGHLLGRLAAPHAGLPAGELVLYLRVVDPGLKYAEPSIGRVVSHAALRGQGQGRVLVGEGVRRCSLAHPGQGIRISAQAHLAGFYGDFGFTTVGEPYGEDNIPHVQMLRPGDLTGVNPGETLGDPVGAAHGAHPPAPQA